MSCTLYKSVIFNYTKLFYLLHEKNKEGNHFIRIKTW